MGRWLINLVVGLIGGGMERAQKLDQTLIRYLKSIHRGRLERAAGALCGGHFLRPYKVGDFISAGGTTDTVTELGLFATTILTPDNVTTVVAIPNVKTSPAPETPVAHRTIG